MNQRWKKQSLLGQQFARLSQEEMTGALIQDQLAI